MQDPGSGNEDGSPASDFTMNVRGAMLLAYSRSHTSSLHGLVAREATCVDFMDRLCRLLLATVFLEIPSRECD